MSSWGLLALLSPLSMSFFSEPEPPWKTKKRGLEPSARPSFSEAFFWNECSSSGWSLTLPAKTRTNVKARSALVDEALMI